MAEAEGIPPTASTVVPGLSLNYLGRNPMYAYGYSGSIAVQDSETDLLNFDSGSGFIVAKILFNYAVESSNNVSYRVRFNGAIIQMYIVDNGIFYTSPDNTIHLLIPPFTAVRCTAKNDSSDSGRAQVCSLIGRVYDV